MSDLIGQELGPYRILEQIGAGGMATIFKAYHPATDRYVAVKILPETMGRDANFRQRFRREAKVVAGLEHAHILPVYDYGEAGDQLYLVMRYIQAGTLKERVATAPLSMSEISHVLSQVGAALAYAHRLGVVHRDVKPANVLLDDQGNCYLSDFGLARMMEASVQITATGVGVGTPAYMSPEQGKGEKVDARTDIYSLGVVLYELVTGQVPFHAETPMAVVIKHISAPLPLPTEVNPDVHPAVERVILKALAKNPADRFDNVEELVSAFEAAARLAESEAPSAMPEIPPAETAAPLPPRKALPTRGTVATRQRIPPRWRRVALGASGALLLLLALAFVLNRIPSRVQVGDGRADVEQLVQETKVPAATVTPEPTAALAGFPAASPSPRLAAERARAFAQPILDTIAARSPDYQDDFSDPTSGWPVGSTAEGDAWTYQDDAYLLTVTSLYRNPSGDPCLDIGPEDRPGFTDYVLEMDGQFLSGAQGNWHTIFRQVIPERAPQEGAAYAIGFVPTGLFGLQRGSEPIAEDQPAPSFQGGTAPNRLTIVVHGPHIAIYVNGEPLWHTYDQMSVGGPADLSLGVCNDDPTPLQVRFDNLKIWDISDLALTAAGAARPSRLAAEKARAFAQPILDAIADRSPDYQEDFNDPASGWPVGSTADGDAWAYQDGAYLLTVTSLYRNPGGDPCLDIGPEDRPSFNDYVLEMDGQFLSGAWGNWHTIFRQVIPERAPQEGAAYVVGFVPTALFSLHRAGEFLAENQPAPSFQGGTAPNRLTVVAHGPHIAIYVNGEPLWHTYDQMSVGGPVDLSLGVCNDDPTPLQVRFDNLKIWDISDLPRPAP